MRASLNISLTISCAVPPGLAVSCGADDPATSATSGGSAGTASTGASTTSPTATASPTTGATTGPTTGASTGADTGAPAPVCGDAIVEGDESCDDGADNGADKACKDDCTPNVCGDGFVGPDESCDDGAGNDDHHACTSHCKLAQCGDGLVKSRGDDPEQCDNGADNGPGGPCSADCTINTCGDGLLDPGEQCDDGNDTPLDGCESTCKSTLMQVEAGDSFTCVLLGTGAVRCWGNNPYGQLGQGHTDILGDEPGEMPTQDVDLGGPAQQIALGSSHACALMADGAVRCWGRNDAGQLGQGHTDSLGDQPGEMPPPPVPLGAKAVQISTRRHHVCALMESGAVRCWGNNASGQLGLGHTESLGDQPGEMPPPEVPIGPGISELFVGGTFNCVRIGVEIRCWGGNTQGTLGYNHANNLGDDPGELPTPVVPVGGPVARLCGGFHSACAVRSDGLLHYWGGNGSGQLGAGHTFAVGTLPGDLPTIPVPVGGYVVSVASHFTHSCALLDDGAVRCWGSNANGPLGYGHSMALGDEPGELPTDDVALGEPAVQLATGLAHSCAILVSGGLRCWGQASGGQLGLGSKNNIGDDESPISAPLVPFL